MISVMSTTSTEIAFIGGGNMATAIIGGLLRQGRAAASILVIDPVAEQRERLQTTLGVQTAAGPDAALAQAHTVVWAVKPQQFKEAAAACAAQCPQALHYSVMAGLRTDDMARLLGTPRIVRAMPNTPALVGQGVTGVYVRPEVTADERAAIARMIESTGQHVWVEREADLDAVTALSGSGPAYVFYFIEAMVQAAQDMGLSAEQGRQLALATFVAAMRAAEQRAGELGDEFGR